MAMFSLKLFSVGSSEKKNQISVMQAVCNIWSRPWREM